MVLVAERDVILAVHEPLELLVHRINRVFFLLHKVARINPELTILLLMSGRPLLAM